MKKKPTPLEKLISNKERVKVLSQIQENKLNANLRYVQQNGGKLIVSGMVSALLPGIQSNVEKREGGVPLPSSAITGLAMGGVLDYFTKAKHMFPFVLSVAQPFLLTWGIKGAKTLIGHLLSGKKKGKK